MTYSDATKLQKEIARKVVARDDFVRISRVCGVDVAYDGDIAYCSAVVMEGQSVVECADSQTVVTHPYVPELLMLRDRASSVYAYDAKGRLWAFAGRRPRAFASKEMWPGMLSWRIA